MGWALICQGPGLLIRYHIYKSLATKTSTFCTCHNTTHSSPVKKKQQARLYTKRASPSHNVCSSASCNLGALQSPLSENIGTNLTQSE